MSCPYQRSSLLPRQRKLQQKFSTALDYDGTWYTLRQECASHVSMCTLCFVVYFFLFFHAIYYPRTALALRPSSKSDPGSHSGPSSPLPTTVRAFVFIAKRLQHFLPPSTRVELYLPTLLCTLSS